jgi:group I intron endonuclease
MGCGIYKITNNKNGKVYIGSSVNIESRKYKHFWMLNNNIHDNTHLQNSYNKDDKNLFVFEIIEYCPVESLINRENYHIDKYKSNESAYGYNMATVNEFRRNTYNDEVKLKLSKYNQLKNGNFIKYSLININSGETHIFESLVEGVDYLINNGFSKGSHRNVRGKLSCCLRGKKVNNGNTGNGSIRKTCYSHYFEIIN